MLTATSMVFPPHRVSVSVQSAGHLAMRFAGGNVSKYLGEINKAEGEGSVTVSRGHLSEKRGGGGIRTKRQLFVHKTLNFSLYLSFLSPFSLLFKTLTIDTGKRPIQPKEDC